MNLVIHYNWYYESEGLGRSFAEETFDTVLSAIEGGKPFPFSDKHYEIGLVRASAIDTYWMLAILVIRDTVEDDSIETVNKVFNWLGEAGAAPQSDRSSDIAGGNTLRNCLNNYYTIYKAIVDGKLEEYKPLPDKACEAVKKPEPAGELCSVCGRIHPETQHWLYGYGHKGSSTRSFDHYEGTAKVYKVFTTYENVQYGNLALCRDCEDTIHLAEEIYSKISTCRVWSGLVFGITLMTGIVSMLNGQLAPGIIIALISLLLIYRCAFRCLPPLYYPLFTKREAIKVSLSNTAAANIFRTFKKSALSRKPLLIWNTDEDGMLFHKVTDPQPTLAARYKFDQSEYGKLKEQADKLLAQGKIYNAMCLKHIIKRDIPTPEGMLVFGHILERTGRLKEALSAYSISERLVEDTYIPECEIKRLQNNLNNYGRGNIMMDDDVLRGYLAERPNRIAKIKALLNKPSKRRARKAARLLWYLLAANDIEGYELYAGAMDILKKTDISARVQNLLRQLKEDFKDNNLKASAI